MKYYVVLILLLLNISLKAELFKHSDEIETKLEKRTINRKTGLFYRKNRKFSEPAPVLKLVFGRNGLIRSKLFIKSDGRKIYKKNTDNGEIDHIHTTKSIQSPR